MIVTTLPRSTWFPAFGLCEITVPVVSELCCSTTLTFRPTLLNADLAEDSVSPTTLGTLTKPAETVMLTSVPSVTVVPCSGD